MNGSNSVDDFAGKISGLASQSSSLGATIEEPKLVKKFHTGLPREKFIHMVASLEQVLDLNTTTFVDIVGRLKAYEERIGEVSSVEDQGKLMFTNTSNNRGGYSGFRGGSRGRGGFGRGGYSRGSFGRGGFGRGKGRGLFDGQIQGGEPQKITKTNQRKTYRK
ncbi:PREDICTED: pupal cuticle protein 36-like [Camelina sativa]|uniref:Pupal cuticle protein 36-like n=1 Tax=Camelina sativa TaxID=90675 RepID=A0ABM0YXB7_CAMSA|nr:PREDICTED: pupal cuticle protein 36-like [Camelina sativa]